MASFEQQAPRAAHPDAPSMPPGGARQLFDIQQRPGSDACAVDAENAYNGGILGYNVYNAHGASLDALIGFSSQHNNLRFTDGLGTPPPDVIDTDTVLRQGYSWEPRGRVQLNTRTYQGPADRPVLPL